MASRRFIGVPVKPISSDYDAARMTQIIGSVVDKILSQPSPPTRSCSTATAHPIGVGTNKPEVAEYLPEVPPTQIAIPDLTGATQIGEGVYGVVYSVYDPSTNRTIVYKRIDKSKSKPELVQNEVRILNYLRDFCDPYFLCYIDYINDAEYFFIVTEFLGGYVGLETFSPKTPAETERVIDNLIRGLTLIHQLGIAHRDIKPENCMVDPVSLNVKYIDFGLSCYGTGCQTNRPVGTPLFAAPELLHRRRDPFTLEDFQRADLWALGMTIFELVTGQNYFDAFLAKFILPEYTPKLRVPAYRSFSLRVLLNLLMSRPEPLPIAPLLTSDCHLGLLETLLEKDPNRRSARPVSPR